MDRFDVIQFADLTGPEGGPWVKIGGGSFGVVYQGEYLGTPVAIKEVLPNNTYDVEKYFERECVLMKEARHPNIVQYIGLTKSPGPDGRIYIISEFVGGNVRSYIADKKRSFPWRLRMSFAMDIARALAYLHARNCMHRDLKGENLLITPNERVKVCDFGFARIAARNQEEMRRISYCGTDGYMSPEILQGIDFSLPSDVFSLGVIFCEIASRHLVDSTTFKREMPSFGLDAQEIRNMASQECPEDFLQLCIDCVHVEAPMRPDMREVVRRLRNIEIQVVRREQARELQRGGTLKAVGSIKGISMKVILDSNSKQGNSRRPAAGPRLPSFEGKVRLSDHEERRGRSEESSSSRVSAASSAEDDEDDLEAALAELEEIQIRPTADAATSSSVKVSGYGNPWWCDHQGSALPTQPRSWLPATPTEETVIDQQTTLNDKNSGSQALGRRDTQGKDHSNSVGRPFKVQPSIYKRPAESVLRSNVHQTEPVGQVLDSNITVTPVGTSQSFSQRRDVNAHVSFMTTSPRVTERGAGMHNKDPSLAAATVASSIYSPAPLFHRFTLVKNGTRRPPSLSKIKATAAAAKDGKDIASALGLGGSFVPPAVMLANALAKCHVCAKRIGWKPFLDCDDCLYKCHIACGEMAEPNCQEIQIPSTGRGSAVLTSINALGVSGRENNDDDDGRSQCANSQKNQDVRRREERQTGERDQSPALHELRRAAAAAAAQATYAAEGGEAPPLLNKDSTMKQCYPSPKATYDVDENRSLAWSDGQPAKDSKSPGEQQPQIANPRQKTTSRLRRWSKGPLVRT